MVARQVTEDRGQDIERIIAILEHTYGSPRHGNLDDPLDELIYIKLSQQTNAAKFQHVNAELRRRYGSWENMRRADESEIAEVLRYIGFHRQRARQIKAMLDRIHSDRGELDLQWLRERPTDEAIAYLRSLPGVGIKSAYCVAMYSLGVDVLPVDTHVERVCTRVGLVPVQLSLRSRQGDNVAIHQLLEDLIPRGKRYSFHVNCVAHGRAICTTKNPKCGVCPINQLCAYGQREVRGSASMPA